MITHRIETTVEPVGNPVRDSIGGTPILPEDLDLPRCECGESMTLFLQFDVRPAFGLPFEAGSHFSVFMCPAHNDVPEPFLTGSQLPNAFWAHRRMIGGGPRFYEMILHRPSLREIVHARDPFLQLRALRFKTETERAGREGAVLREHSEYLGVSLSLGEPVTGIQAFKVGGQPSWAQTPETYRCCCGAEMRFLAQVPADWGFPKLNDAPSQPDSFSAEEYCLFLGNETYFFACEAQCNPRAVHATVQN